jgi:two-component system alkaline phosphatase synthesis response regulator PhoP
MSHDAPAWFRALVDSTCDVYFRFRLRHPRRFEYLSPSIETLTGHSRAAFDNDPSLCFGIVGREDRRLLRQILRASRGLTLRLNIRRGKALVPVELRTVAVLEHRKLVAVEGVARTMEMPLLTHGAGTLDEPVQQRLVALMGEVHALLHRAMPAKPAEPSIRRLGNVAFDIDRLVVTENGSAVELTSREIMVLRYLVLRQGRIVTRQNLLSGVWNAEYDGDERTVDVHVSRLRKKLPSLRTRLTAVKGLGYRLEDDERPVRAANE